jgi:4-hydroxybenzoate polyprenyltransferase/phosphoserine phosphatase
MTAQEKLRAAEQSKPLVVDLDGTLIRSDLLIETAFTELGARPQTIFELFGALLKGKAALKHRLADASKFDASMLPYDDAVLACIKQAKADGRLVYLASASNEALVGAVAEELGLFDGWFGSSEDRNLSGKAKADKLVTAFGEQGFDYIGNDKADLEVWSRADTAICIRTSPAVLAALAKRDRPIEQLESDKPTLKTWIKLIRVHQWAKNSLVFVPLLTSLSFNLEMVGLSILAAIAYSLCASSIYVLNDLVDLPADRGHPTKRNRPLANGSIPLVQAMLVMPVLLAAGLGIAAMISLPFLGVVVAYLAMTTAYSFFLKRKLMLDAVTLALLYTMRVIGGAVAISVDVSFWLLAFSLFIFTSLALLKRYIELTTRLDNGLADPSNRNYKIADADVVMAISAAAGLNATTVLTLYLHSAHLPSEYQRPEALWALFPLLLYWIGRALVLAHRRFIDDDPIVFAIRDRVSRYTVVAMVVVVAVARFAPAA